MAKKMAAERILSLASVVCRCGGRLLQEDAPVADSRPDAIPDADVRPEADIRPDSDNRLDADNRHDAENIPDADCGADIEPDLESPFDMEFECRTGNVSPFYVADLLVGQSAVFGG